LADDHAVGSFALTTNDHDDGGAAPTALRRPSTAFRSDDEGPGYGALVVATVAAVVLSIIVNETIAGYRRSHQPPMPTHRAPVVSTRPSAPPVTVAATPAAPVVRLTGDSTLVTVRVTNIAKRTGEGCSWLVVDLELGPKELRDSAKGLQGILQFADEYGDARVEADFEMVQVIVPGTTTQATGYRLVMDEFDAGMQWLARAKLEDVWPRFVVQRILSNDGTVKTCGGDR